MNFNYSFIIPHHNTPDLLQRLIDSIPQREDIEIIVVDDNSDADKKPQLSRKDVEVILLDAEHSKGAGRARNVGLQHAKGKWLLFADADDYYTHCLSNILDKYACDGTTDIVYLNACEFDENGNIKPYKTNRLIIDYLNGVKDAEMNLRYALWTPWSRMVKKSIVDIHNIWFDELPAGNDLMFGLKSSRYSKMLRVEDNVVYKYYRPRKGSCTDTARNQMLESRLMLKGNIINFYREVGYNTNSNLFGLIYLYIRANNHSFKVFKTYKEYLRLYKIPMFLDIKRFVVKQIQNSLFNKDTI